MHWFIAPALLVLLLPLPPGAGATLIVEDQEFSAVHQVPDATDVEFRRCTFHEGLHFTNSAALKQRRIRIFDSVFNNGWGIQFPHGVQLDSGSLFHMRGVAMHRHPSAQGDYFNVHLQLIGMFDSTLLIENATLEQVHSLESSQYNIAIQRHFSVADRAPVLHSSFSFVSSRFIISSTNDYHGARNLQFEEIDARHCFVNVTRNDFRIDSQLNAFNVELHYQSSWEATEIVIARNHFQSTVTDGVGNNVMFRGYSRNDDVTIVDNHMNSTGGVQGCSNIQGFNGTRVGGSMLISNNVLEAQGPAAAPIIFEIMLENENCLISQNLIRTGGWIVGGVLFADITDSVITVEMNEIQIHTVGSIMIGIGLWGLDDGEPRSITNGTLIATTNVITAAPSPGTSAMAFALNGATAKHKFSHMHVIIERNQVTIRPLIAAPVASTGRKVLWAPPPPPKASMRRCSDNLLPGVRAMLEGLDANDPGMSLGQGLLFSTFISDSAMDVQGNTVEVFTGAWTQAYLAYFHHVVLRVRQVWEGNALYVSIGSEGGSVDGFRFSHGPHGSEVELRNNHISLNSDTPSGQLRLFHGGGSLQPPQQLCQVLINNTIWFGGTTEYSTVFHDSTNLYSVTRTLINNVIGMRPQGDKRMHRLGWGARCFGVCEWLIVNLRFDGAVLTIGDPHNFTAVDVHVTAGGIVFDRAEAPTRRNITMINVQLAAGSAVRFHHGIGIDHNSNFYFERVVIPLPPTPVVDQYPYFDLRLLTNTDDGEISSGHRFAWVDCSIDVLADNPFLSHGTRSKSRGIRLGSYGGVRLANVEVLLLRTRVAVSAPIGNFTAQDAFDFDYELLTDSTVTIDSCQLGAVAAVPSWSVGLRLGGTRDDDCDVAERVVVRIVNSQLAAHGFDDTARSVYLDGCFFDCDIVLQNNIMRSHLSAANSDEMDIGAGALVMRASHSQIKMIDNVIDVTGRGFAITVALGFEVMQHSTLTIRGNHATEGSDTGGGVISTVVIIGNTITIEDNTLRGAGGLMLRMGIVFGFPMPGTPPDNEDNTIVIRRNEIEVRSGPNGNGHVSGIVLGGGITALVNCDLSITNNTITMLLGDPPATGLTQRRTLQGCETPLDEAIVNAFGDPAAGIVGVTSLITAPQLTTIRRFLIANNTMSLEVAEVGAGDAHGLYFANSVFATGAPLEVEDNVVDLRTADGDAQCITIAAPWYHAVLNLRRNVLHASASNAGATSAGGFLRVREGAALQSVCVLVSHQHFDAAEWQHVSFILAGGQLLNTSLAVEHSHVQLSGGEAAAFFVSQSDPSERLNLTITASTIDVSSEAGLTAVFVALSDPVHAAVEIAKCGLELRSASGVAAIFMTLTDSAALSGVRAVVEGCDIDISAGEFAGVSYFGALVARSVAFTVRNNTITASADLAVGIALLPGSSSVVADNVLHIFGGTTSVGVALRTSPRLVDAVITGNVMYVHSDSSGAATTVGHLAGLLLSREGASFGPPVAQRMITFAHNVGEVVVVGEPAGAPRTRGCVAWLEEGPDAPLDERLWMEVRVDENDMTCAGGAIALMNLTAKETLLDFRARLNRFTLTDSSAIILSDSACIDCLFELDTNHFTMPVGTLATRAFASDWSLAGNNTTLHSLCNRVNGEMVVMSDAPAGVVEFRGCTQTQPPTPSLTRSPPPTLTPSRTASTSTPPTPTRSHSDTVPMPGTATRTYSAAASASGSASRTPSTLLPPPAQRAHTTRTLTEPQVVSLPPPNLVVNIKDSTSPLRDGESAVVHISWSSIRERLLVALFIETDLLTSEITGGLLSQPPLCDFTQLVNGSLHPCGVNGSQHIDLLLHYTVPLTRPPTNPRRSVTFIAIAQYHGAEVRANATVVIAPPTSALRARMPPFIAGIHPPPGDAPPGTTVTVFGANLTSLPPFVPWGPHLLSLNVSADGMTATTMVPPPLMIPSGFSWEQSDPDTIIELIRLNANATPGAVAYLDAALAAGVDVTSALLGGAPDPSTFVVNFQPLVTPPLDNVTFTRNGSVLTLSNPDTGNLPDFAWFGPLLLPVSKHYGPSNDGMYLEITHATITLPPDVIIPPGFNASDPDSVLELILANANASGPEAYRRVEQLLASGRLNATVVPLLLGADPRDPGATRLHFTALNNQPFAVAAPRLELQPLSADFRDGPQIFVLHDVNHAAEVRYTTELTLDAVAGAAIDGTPRLEFVYNASEPNTSHRIVLLLHANMTADDLLDPNVTTAITLRLRGAGDGSTFLDQHYTWVVQQRKAVPSFAVRVEPHEDYRGTVHVNVSGGNSPARGLHLRLTPVNALVATTLESDDPRCVAVPGDSALECELGTITESPSSTRRRIERAGAQLNISAAVPSYFALPVRVAFTVTGRNIATIAGIAWLTRDGSLIPNVFDDDEEDGDGHFIPPGSPPADDPALAPQETQLPAQPARALRLSAIFDTDGCVERVHFVLVTLLVYAAVMVVRVPYYLLQRRAALRQPGRLSAVPTHDVGLIRGLLPLHVWVGALWPFHFDVCFAQTTQLLVHVLAIFTFGSALHNAFGAAISSSASRAVLLGFFAAAMATALRPLTHIYYALYRTEERAGSARFASLMRRLPALRYQQEAHEVRGYHFELDNVVPPQPAPALEIADGLEEEPEKETMTSYDATGPAPTKKVDEFGAVALPVTVVVVRCRNYRMVGHAICALLALTLVLTTLYTTSSWCRAETDAFLRHELLAALLIDACVTHPIFLGVMCAYRWVSKNSSGAVVMNAFPIDTQMLQGEALVRND